MKVNDLHILPKFRDSWSYLYVEHCKIEKDNQAIAIINDDGKLPVPCANLALLMLGPGVSITHAAINTLVDHGCLVAWCGEGGVRFYALGIGETRSASRLLHQAKLWANPKLCIQVVRRLYQARFSEKLPDNLSIRQIRGMEGLRVRKAYERFSKEYGIHWSRRNYRRDNWYEADLLNRALSTANSCLYGICHSAIVTAGFSPAIGFIHFGRALSFVYDVADLYKTDITIPVAFQTAAQNPANLERQTRIACRDYFLKTRLLEKIIPDIIRILDYPTTEDTNTENVDADLFAPSPLWDPEDGSVPGAQQYSNNPQQQQTENDSTDT